MISELRLWKEKLEQGWKKGCDAYERYKAYVQGAHETIALCGMGGSGIAGKIIALTVQRNTSQRMVVIDGPNADRTIGSNDLAFIISYSGNTWEMLDLFEELYARKTKIVVISHGGALSKRAQECNVPLIAMPAAQTPRSALGDFLGILYGFLDRLGVLKAEGIVRGYAEIFSTHAKALEDAAFFGDFITNADRDFFYILGVQGDSYPAAFRAQTQFNENGKISAVATALPEAHHNLLASFIQYEKSSKKPLIVLYSTDFVSAHLKRAIDAFCALMQQEGIALYKPRLLGDTWEKQLFYSILWADFASYHLAKKRGVDIEAVTLIDQLKARIDSHH